MLEEAKIEWADNFEPRRAPRSVDRLEDILWRGERDHGEQIALKSEALELSYARLARTVRSLAVGLSQQGVKPQSKALLQVERGPAWLITYFSLQALGVTVIPVPPEPAPGIIARARQLADPGAAFVDRGLRAELEWPGDFENQLFTVNTVEELLEEIGGDADRFEPQAADGDQVASIFFTSGTTGEARGVCLTHSNFLADLDGLYQLGEFGPEDRFLSLLPPFHAYGFTGDQLLPLYTGATIVYARQLVSSAIIKHLREDRITVMLGVPLLFQKMRENIRRKISRASAPKQWLFKLGRKLGESGGIFGRLGQKTMEKLVRDRYFPDLRFFVSGGAPLNPEIPRFFDSLGVTMLQGYGLTELSPVVTVTPPQGKHPASVGKVLPGCQAGVYDPDESGLGEIVVRGPIVFDRYLDEESGTHGIFRTGDVGYVEAGRLFVRGRQKNTVVTAEGKNIFPERVEEVYLESEYIAEMIVVAAPRKDAGGSQLKAIVFPDEENAATDFGDQILQEENMVKLIGDELKSHGEKLSDFQRVRDYELRWEPFPKTPTKKIKRFLFDHQVHSI